VFPLKDNIPTDRFPVVTVLFIVANVFVYFFLQDALLGLPQEGLGGNWPTPTYAAIPCEITGPGPCRTAPGGPPTWATLFTAMFMHGSILHLGGNMLFLWIFGNNVEDSMGRVKFVAFYLLGGLAAFLAQTLVGTDSEIPTIGASGAVAGVLGGYLLIFPRARVVTVVFIIFFFTIIELPRPALPGHLVRPAGAVRLLRPDQPDRRGRRRRVLRAHRRLRLRAADDPAARQPAKAQPRVRA
jgi:membrane associated rhomboid family serine protease